VTDVNPLPASDRAGELILHRPHLPTAGAIRRIHVYLDDRHLADLAQGDTARVRTAEGPHLLRGQCKPLISGDCPFILTARQTLHAEIYIGALGEVEIHLADQPTR
jgi:hypothetical protein